MVGRIRRFIKTWTSVAFLAFSPPALLAEAEAPAERLSSYMLSRAEAGFSGAVLVAQGSEIFLRAGYGFANVEHEVRNTPETLFRIGSVTKPLVATATLRLIAKGRLRLDDPLGKFIPDCPEAWHQVSIEELLSHTSGVPDLFSRVATGSPSDLRNLLDATLDQFANSALRSEPGSTYAYNNFGYLLLAYVIEVADGRPWLEIMQSEVFSTAKLQSTRYDDVWAIVPGRAHGYQRQQTEILNTRYKDHGAFSAGGILSTVDDLRRFVTALEDGTLLSEELQDRMTTPVKDDYGLGWQVTRIFDRPAINHTGGIEGFSAHLAGYPAERLFVAVLSNIETTPVKALACDLAALALGIQQPILGRHLPADADTSWFDLVTGNYFGTDGEARTVLRQGDSLKLQRDTTSYSLMPVGFRMFTLDGSPGRILEFEGAPKEPATGFTIKSCGNVLFTASAAKNGNLATPG